MTRLYNWESTLHSTSPKSSFPIETLQVGTVDLSTVHADLDVSTYRYVLNNEDAPSRFIWLRPLSTKKQRESAGVWLICSMNLGKLVAFKPTLVNLGKKLTLCRKIWWSNTSLAGRPLQKSRESAGVWLIWVMNLGKLVASIPTLVNFGKKLTLC